MRNARIYRPLLKVMLATLIMCYGTLDKVLGQCYQEVREAAIAESGVDALFLKDFPVKLKEGNMKNPSKIQKHKVLLSEGVHYRFNVKNNNTYEGEAILQLKDKNVLLGSTFDKENNDNKGVFEFLCTETKTYTILLSFIQSKKGCAIGVMSMVLLDTTSIYDPRITNDSITEVLYRGIENPLNIAASGVTDGYLDVTATNKNAVVSEKNGKFSVTVEDLGFVDIVVNSRKADGSLNEVDTTTFRVKDLPTPTMMLNGVNGGFIDKNVLRRTQKVGLLWTVRVEPKEYKVQAIIISRDQLGLNGIRSINENLTASQRRFLNGLSINEVFFISAIIQMPSGETLRTVPTRFVVL